MFYERVEHRSLLRETYVLFLFLDETESNKLIQAKTQLSGVTRINVQHFNVFI